MSPIGSGTRWLRFCEKESELVDRREVIDDLRSTDLVRSSSDEEASLVMVFQRADLRRLIFWASTVFIQTQKIEL